MKLSIPPTQSELEELRVECAKEAGVQWWEPCPRHTTSYDAIIPEIQKLSDWELSVFSLKLSEIYGTSDEITILDCFQFEPHELALAWLHVKQQNK